MSASISSSLRSMVSRLLMASSRVILLPASCLSTSAFFLHFPAKILNVFPPKLRFKFNQPFTASLFHLCLFPAFAPTFQIFSRQNSYSTSINQSIKAYLFHLCLLPAFATKFQIFSIPNWASINIYRSLRFTSIRAEISDFFPPKLSNKQSFTASLFPLYILPAFVPKFQIFSSHVPSLCFICIGTKFYHFPPKQSANQPFTASLFNLLIFPWIDAEFSAFFFVLAGSQ